MIDHEGMADWWPLKKAQLLRHGDDDKNGPGAIRELHRPGMTLKEQVTGWNPPYGYQYRLLKGAPLNDHSGSVELTEVGGKTRVRWTIEFNPMIPGTGLITRSVLTRLLKSVLGKLQSNLQ